MLYLLFFLIALISMSYLLYINVNVFLAFLITLVTMLVCNYIIGYIMLRVQRNILDWECDPERYMRMLDKRERRFHKNDRVLSHIAVNRAVGYMLLGHFESARDLLEGIDIAYLSEKDESYLIYTINLILCYYELGELEKAELLYETKLVRLSPLGKRVRKTIDLLIGERYFYLQKYDASYEHLQKLLNRDLSKRQYLGTLFRLAQMEIMKGDKEKAAAKLKKIIKHGNQLWIVKTSEEMLKTCEPIRS